MAMTKTIDMQDLRYLNLFNKITRVNTRFVLHYNEMLIFLVPRQLLKKALGKNSENLKKMSDIVKKRIRIIPIPKGVEHVKEFIVAIVKPVEFSELEVKDDEIVLTAGRQSKAALLGRNKRRLLEMQNIIRDFFGREFKIV